LAWREDRRHRLARPLPHLPFRRQQTIAQDRAQDQPPHVRHFVVGGILDENVADEAGIVDDQGALVDELRLDPGQRIGRFAPEFERIAKNGADDLQPRGNAGSRDGRGRLERLRSRVHDDAFPDRSISKCYSDLTRLLQTRGSVAFQFFTAQSRTGFT
jgi:hypothetical protein